MRKVPTLRISHSTWLTKFDCLVLSCITTKTRSFFPVRKWENKYLRIIAQQVFNQFDIEPLITTSLVQIAVFL